MVRPILRSPSHDQRWSARRANDWYQEQRWPVGCNFIPSTAVNQLEMWQAETFDPSTIDRELGWAAAAGMNAVRVFLHDQAYAADPGGTLERIDHFLKLAQRHGLRTMPVLFDDCWHAGARVGPQPEPVPGRHNSRWLQSPGIDAALDPEQRDRLRAYVDGVVGAFAQDKRVFVWDLYNEIGNFFLPLLSQSWWRKWPALSAAFMRFRLTLPPTLPLLDQVFDWVRLLSPVQPLTAASWIAHPRLSEFLHTRSDVISFHNYEAPEHLSAQITELQEHGRPLLCTEFMARTRGSTLEAALPVFQRQQVGCFCWGLVRGRTQTHFSWEDRDGRTPSVWYHDLFEPDGTPYDKREIQWLVKITRTVP